LILKYFHAQHLLLLQLPSSQSLFKYEWEEAKTQLWF
jgi:hypothetical protein